MIAPPAGDALNLEQSAAKFVLSDGRALGFAEQGDPSGTPIFFFHGLPGSRLMRHPDGSVAQRLGIRLITFDRPGLGLSTLQPQRRILDWPRDVAEFADANAFDRFRVLGWSGGAPYALATAHELPDRVTRVGLVAPMSPLAGSSLTRELAPDLRRRARVGRVAPWLLRMAVARDRRAFTHDPAGFKEREFAKSPACDHVVLDDPALRQMLIDNQSEAYRHGTRGLTADARLYLRPWGFDPSRVRVPIQLWLGERDETLSPAMGRYFAEKLPGIDTTRLTGEGHMLCLTQWEQILRALARTA